MIKRLIYCLFLTFLWLGGMSSKTVINSCFLTLFVTYIILPSIYRLSSFLQRHLVFLPFVNYPWGVDFNKPEDCGLPGTRNFYLETQKDVRVGVWHILPENLIESCPHGESLDVVASFFEESLSDHRPIVLYLHGNTSSRAVAHRVELYKLLRSQDMHVVTFDYRGYADSSSTCLSEEGVVHDAKCVYEYIKKLSGSSKLIVWGHSLGTGVSCHVVSLLTNEGNSPTGLILESPFNNIRDEVMFHPLAAIFRKMPKFGWFFLDPLKKSGIEFKSDEHIANIQSPILILHAEDDLVVPYFLGRKLYDSALAKRDPVWPTVRFVSFEGVHGYGHKFICRSPQLKNIVREFFDSC